MKRLVVSTLLLCSTMILGSQIRRTPPSSLRFPRLNIQADKMTRYGGFERYTGDVQIVSDSFVIRADEVDFNTEKHTAEIHGGVSLQLLPAQR
jgi:lipopolysaccharide assembly outer membrane protein LptD (OstA)